MTAKDASAFKGFDTYDFENDLAFQTGLKSIPNNADPRVLEQAKLFYYSKTVAPLNTAKYPEWKKAAHTGTSEEANASDSQPGTDDAQKLTDASIPGAPYSASFAEVVDMIMKGKEIPGICDIPDKLNDQTPSESTSIAPPKPWESQQQNKP
ncbi:hypothetical protein GGI23_000987 [Coemansia sp. RSA 2559]|nr:hypothetical protein GGI23_000987 [Coemansia sp. RSA 2559]KAJ2860250.1 hypothetical protein GGI22_002762 [Coemansia erecta]KAJ2863130.1 hypothetical protein GGI22_002033 [Coemansia erecta]